jgi:hypothetical protein
MTLPPLPPQTKRQRAFNLDHLTPLAFLLAVMHDQTWPLSTRIRAATFALPLTSPPGPTRVHPELVIQVPSLPEPGFDTLQ